MPRPCSSSCTTAVTPTPRTTADRPRWPAQCSRATRTWPGHWLTPERIPTPAPRRRVTPPGCSPGTTSWNCWAELLENVTRPWPALWSLVIGFFMILIDTTIVSVANPRIMEGLDTDINAVIWVTSAYLLAYAVPLLITGRLGDRFGPKKLYLSGLVVFTLASLWCGLSGT